MIGGFAKISDALKDFLEGETFSTQPTEFKRLNQFYLQTEKAEDLKCIVAPIEVPVLSGTRSRNQRNWRIGVWLIQTIVESDADQHRDREDELMRVVDEVEEKLFEKQAITIDDRALSLQLLTDVPRTPFSAVAAMQHKTFLASLEVVVSEQ